MQDSFYLFYGNWIEIEIEKTKYFSRNKNYHRAVIRAMTTWTDRITDGQWKNIEN